MVDPRMERTPTRRPPLMEDPRMAPTPTRRPTLTTHHPEMRALRPRLKTPSTEAEKLLPARTRCPWVTASDQTCPVSHLLMLMTQGRKKR